jgi:hypothetical protein
MNSKRRLRPPRPAKEDVNSATRLPGAPNQETKMRSLLVAFTFAMFVATVAVTCARAQTPSLPTTMKLYDNRSGEVVGTATFMDRRTMILRDLNGEVVGQVIFEKDGSRTFLDPSGKPVDTLSIAGPIKLPDND